MNENIKVATIARTIVLIVALINQGLVMAGKSPLPFEDEGITSAVSFIFTTVAAVVSWWNNNSFTKNAIKADNVLDELNKNK